MRILYILFIIILIYGITHRLAKCYIDKLPLRADIDKRAVFSLTTLPSRSKKIYPTIYSLLDQTLPLRIEIHIPEKANPESNKCYSFPESIKNHPNIEIITHPIDLGPSMKFIPAMYKDRKGSPVHIISVDDDMIYPRNLAEKLVEAAEKDPLSIHCVRGNSFKGQASYYSSPTTYSHNISTRKRVAIVTGCGGYIIPYPVAEKLKPIVGDYSKAPKECRIMDDVWISGLATKLGIKKYVIPGVPKYSISIGAFFTPAYLNPGRERKNEVAIQYFNWDSGEIEK